MNRSYTRARNGKLRGHQLDLAFPRRGRPSKHRVLERCGQMRLDLSAAVKPKVEFRPFGDFGTRPAPLSDDELEREFYRLFPD